MEHTPDIPSPPAGGGVFARLARIRADLAEVTAALAAGALTEVPEAALPEATVELLAVSDRAAAASVVLARVHRSWPLG
jgi:hypothetical protein